MASNPIVRRPIAMRLLPARLRAWFYHRHFARRHSDYLPLFDRAPLRRMPHLSMYDLRPGDVISGHIAFDGEYESDFTTRLLAHAREGGLLVDVGANMGYFSLLWAGTRADNRVVALEASPAVVAMLTANVERNGLSDRVRILAKAASDSAGIVRFATGPSDQTGWGGIAPADAAGIDVPAIRIDAELADETIAVLKIDVEGAELWVVRGCEALLRERRIRHIFFEHNATRTKELDIADDGVVTYLESMGYRCRPLDAEQNDWHAEPA